MKTVTSWFRFVAGISATAALACTSHAQDAATNSFGFVGREIFPIENGISQLHVADMDGAG